MASGRRSKRRRRWAVVLGAVLLAAGLAALSQPLVRQSNTGAQRAYSRGDFAGAEQILNRLISSGQGARDADALVLRGLARQKLGRSALAEADLRLALRLAPDYADAWYGLALVQRGRGEEQEAARSVERALELDPRRPEFLALRGTLPGVLGPREARARPAELRLPFVARAGRLRFADGRPLDVKGVNLGVALPGRFPAEFPDEATFDTWLGQLGALHANVLRVYTLLPPDFYRALLRYNRAHPRAPLYLIQGVWTELPPGHDYRGVFERSFTAEMDRVLGAVHGDADLPERRGHAGGRYGSDVSPYLLAFIVGREWEPYSVTAFGRLAREETRYAGRYFATRNASPLETWLARVMDHLAGEQMRRYHQLTPVAFTNWPTLDPLHHGSEATQSEERALRRARGEPTGDTPGETVNEDEVGLDARHIVATAANPAGTFASYHAYPYYPDFLNNDPAYRRWPGGHYAGYLADLKRHHGDQPVLISETGVPSSRGAAHFQAQGQNHGGHSESEQARLDVALDRQVRAAGLAGTVLFAWLDEWFKRNWLYLGLEQPAEHDVRWHNVLDPEENYGLIAAEPVGEFGLCGDRAARLPAVAGVPGLRALATPSYLHLVWPVPAAGRTTLFLDTHPAPGAEFRVDLDRAGGRLLVNAGYQFFKARREGPQLVYRLDPGAVPRPGAPFVPYRTLPNVRRIGRDGTVYPARLDEPGRLRIGPPEGAHHDATRDFCQRDGLIHLRLPWTLIGVTDPSERRVYDGAHPGRGRPVPDIGVTLAGRSARLSWPTWVNPPFRLREKAVYRAFQQEWTPAGERDR